VNARRIPTPSQTVGPFFGIGLPFEGDSEAVSRSPAEAIRVEGQMLDGSGEPVPDGLVEVWSGQQFARCRTDPEGAFHFTVTKPSPDAGDNAPHLNINVFARGLLRHLATRMYFPDEALANVQDRVLGQVDPRRRETLVARFEDGVLRFDIRLQGESETVFFQL
jgi:protocatechuate 3,4-dioxygenase, alpha subunit